ncbi:MAG: DUF58 domain-containing protein [Methylomonas sp.]|nr:DUF58 domain-containing protein [Methylomonas sp.]
MKSAADTDNERIRVSLTTLVDLAKTASALNLPARQIRATQGGNYVSHFKGRGMSFAETRLYQPGDDVRLMDWRVTARTDKPHSKVFQEERERPMFISVDYRPSMMFATRGVFKSVQAAKLAGLLAWAAQQQGDRVGGQIFGDYGCMELKPRTGRSALLRFLNALVQPSYTDVGDNTLDHMFSRLQHHARPGSRVYIISDFRGLETAAENHLALLARHCEVVLIQVYDPMESELPEQGRYRFTDRIRDIVVDCGDKQVLHAYRQRFQRRQAYLKQLSQKLRLGFCACSTHQAPFEVLSAARRRWMA